MSPETARRIDAPENLASVYDTETSMCYWKDTDGHWWLYLPGCGIANLRGHEVTEHEDGTISVMPSILVHGHPSARHGYLAQGVWSECQ